MNKFKNVNYKVKKERVSFEDKKKINHTISELMKLGYSEDEAKLQVSMWIGSWE